LEVDEAETLKLKERERRASGSPPPANGSTTAPTASSSRRASCAPRLRLGPTASKSTSRPA
jgi:hypothetical protein